MPTRFLQIVHAVVFVALTGTGTVFNLPSFVSTQDVDVSGSLVPDPVTNRSILMCLMIERDTGPTFIYDYDRSQAAIYLAVQYANWYLMPPGYNLTTLYVDIGRQCEPTSHITGYAMNLTDHGIKCQVYIGPGCGSAAEALYDYADFYDTPIIGCPAAGLGSSDSIGEYGKMTRISVTFTTLGDVLKRFMSYENYTTPIFFLDQSVAFFNEMGMVITSSIRQRYWTLYFNSKFMPFRSENLSPIVLRNMLRKGSSTSRVFVMISNATTVRNFMIMADSLGMTSGDYVFLAIELYRSAVWGPFTWNYNDSNDETARRAFSCLLLLSALQSTSDDIDYFWSSVKDFSRKKFHYDLGNSSRVDPVITHFYDAIILYASAVNDMVTNPTVVSDFTSGEDFGDHTTNYTFESPVNGPVSLNNDSDRLWDYVIRNFDTTDGRFEDYLLFYPSGNQPKVLGDISQDWPNGPTLPPNTPLCGFDLVCPKSKVMSKGNLTAAILLPLLTVFSAFGGMGYALKRFNDQEKKRSLDWKIYHHQLSGLDATAAPLGEQIDEGAEDTRSVHHASITEATHATPAVKPSLEGRIFVYLGSRVQVRVLPEPRRRENFGIHREVMAVRRLQYYTLQRVVGILLGDDKICEGVVGELCNKGCLDELLKDEKFDLDWVFKLSLMRDLTSGLTFLHTSPIKSHGHLSSYNCLIDSRFVLKISQFGLPSLVPAKILDPPGDHLPEDAYDMYLWRAPEHLRTVMPTGGSQKGDVYSFGILLHQILFQTEPFKLTKSTEKRERTVNARDIVLEVKRGAEPPLRPPLSRNANPSYSQLSNFIESCWEEDPLLRPTLSRAKLVFSTFTSKTGDHLVDHLVRKMEKYAIGLENQIQEKTAQFMEEKERTGNMLSNILPKVIAQTLMQGTSILPETFESVTVTFADVPGFLELVKQGAPTAASYINSLGLLQDLYDAIVEVRDVYRVESLYDSILVVSGLPHRNEDRHAEEIALLVMEIQRRVANLRLAGIPKTELRLRAGIHSGPCVAGIVGAKLPKYCLFGDTVNTASRMETSGEAGKIQCTLAAKSLLNSKPCYVFVPRGLVDVKGKGKMETFWLLSDKAPSDNRHTTEHTFVATADLDRKDASHGAHLTRIRAYTYPSLPASSNAS